MVSVAARLESLLDRAFEANPVPGVAVGVIAGEQEHIACRGVTSVAHPLPVDGETLFQIGSTVKTLTATTLMRLVAEGHATLDDPVRRHLPGFRVADDEAAAVVTLRHLLTHHAGWQGDLFEDTGRGDDALARYVGRMASLPQLARPGAFFSYSNTAFCVAGRVIEEIAGAPYETAVAELVLQPLGLVAPCFFAEDAITGRVAAGHAARDGHAVIARPWALARAWNPAGGLAASVRDLLTWARFSMGEGTAAAGQRLLPAPLIAEMRQPQAPAGGGRAADVGLSWLIQTTRPVPLLAHGGSTPGQESAFVLAPARGVAIVVLTNSEQGTALHGPLVRLLLDDLVGPSRRPAMDRVPAQELARYRGAFSGYLRDFAVEQRDGGLALWMTPHFDGIRRVHGAQPFGPMELQVFTGERVRVAAGPLRGATGEFVQDSDGAPRWLRLDGQLHARVAGT